LNRIIILRHGESQWNSDNRYTGWIDIELSEKGKEEARNAGIFLKSAGFSFDYVFTSMLKRTINTAWLLLESMNELWVPLEKNWHLNERHFGSFQGCSKIDLEKQFGKEYINSLKTDFFSKPPLISSQENQLTDSDNRYKKSGLSIIPESESLEDTYNRVVPYWQNTILPMILDNKTILIVTHGNIVRILLQYLEQVPGELLFKRDIPTGIPIIIELDERGFLKKYINSILT